jgi:hypothetical protein
MFGMWRPVSRYRLLTRAVLIGADLGAVTAARPKYRALSCATTCARYLDCLSTFLKVNGEYLNSLPVPIDLQQTGRICTPITYSKERARWYRNRKGPSGHLL